MKLGAFISIMLFICNWLIIAGIFLARILWKVIIFTGLWLFIILLVGSHHLFDLAFDLERLKVTDYSKFLIIDYSQIVIATIPTAIIFVINIIKKIKQIRQIEV